MKQFYIGNEEILQNFELINVELKSMDMHGEILIAGGASMCLVFSARSATKDIDAIYEPKSVINTIAAKIALQKGMPELCRTFDVKSVGINLIIVVILVKMGYTYLVTLVWRPHSSRHTSTCSNTITM